MGKSTGFMEYERRNNPAVAPEKRIENFDEFRSPADIQTRQTQAARCMNCGVPFCQSGEMFGGMMSGCPLHNLIPEFNDEIYKGNFDQALNRLLKTNNFPEFTGRVCPALCEAACTCGMNGDSVTVHDNELFVIEQGFANGLMSPRIPAVRSGKRVAVIGSGPCGLAVADQLNHRGHSVVVFEREDRPGGLLMYGIPNMKLSKNIIARRVDLMTREGVEFRTGTNVGVDVTAAELDEVFDAVVLCCGAKKPRDLSIPGRDAAGVYFAVDFLTAATKSLLSHTPTPITAAGKNVVIVGGGDTGNDCVATCIRQGCKSVIQLEMTPKLPDSRTEKNPWPEWPRVCKTDYGQQEAIAVFGHDPRIYSTTVKDIQKDDDGNITQITTVRVSMCKDEKTGRMVPRNEENSEQTLPCEMLLIAAGFTGCEEYVASAFGIERSARGSLNTAQDGFQTESPKVFAAGDAHIGQSLVVRAIAEGRACAAQVDEFLMGYSNM